MSEKMTDERELLNAAINAVISVSRALGDLGMAVERLMEAEQAAWQAGLDEGREQGRAAHD